VVTASLKPKRGCPGLFLVLLLSLSLSLSLSGSRKVRRPTVATAARPPQRPALT
jgi:hypothetical protein